MKPSAISQGLPFLLCAVMAGAADTQAQSPDPATAALVAADSPLMKVSPGDFWKYRVRVQIPAGVTDKQAAAVDTTHERVRTFLGKVPMVKDQPAVDCFEVVAPSSPTTREYVRISDDKVELLGELKMKDGAGVPIVFPAPVLFVHAGWKAGDAAEIQSIGFPKGGGLVAKPTLVVAREEVTVPAGKFPAIRFLMSALDGSVESRRTIWFSPGNGIVKEEASRYAQGHLVVKETQELEAKGNKVLPEAK